VPVLTLAKELDLSSYLGLGNILDQVWAESCLILGLVCYIIGSVPLAANVRIFQEYLDDVGH
jgi:hypothetical protein